MFIRRELAEERYRMFISVYILCSITYKICFGHLNLPPKSATYSTWDRFPLLHCTGHVAAPNFVCECGCMLSHRPFDSVMILSPGSVTLHGGRRFPLPSSWFGLETTRRPFAPGASPPPPQLGSPDFGVYVLNR